MFGITFHLWKELNLLKNCVMIVDDFDKIFDHDFLSFNILHVVENTKVSKELTLSSRKQTIQ